jgi:hypothetical protein
VKSLAIVAVLASTAAAQPAMPPPPPPGGLPALEPPRIDRAEPTPPIDPASTTIEPQPPPFEVVFDSRDAFDSRRKAHPAVVLVDARFAGVFGEVYGTGSATLAMPFAPRYGRFRFGVGFGFVDPDVEVYRVSIGWERWAFCIRRTVCPGAAVDLEYAYADPLDGTLATPHAFIDIKTKRAKGLGLRLAGGPSILMATSTEGGRDRFDIGWSVNVAFGIWAPY